MSAKAQPALLKKEPGKSFDLGIAWNWEFDRDFISQINDTCLRKGLRPYLVYPNNLFETLQLVRERQLKFRCFFDRASDTDHRFSELVQLLLEEGILFIDHPERTKWINDKILIHMDFTINKIPVPPTFIYYPMDERRVISSKIKHVGIPFVVKPAHNVYGRDSGILLNACSIEDVYHWHSRYKDFIFLLQRQVKPCLMKRKPAWFRIFFVLGKIIPCWWDPVKHIYDVVTKEDIVRFRLNPLYELVKQIARIYKLGFFSTEIAIENGRRFVVVDYINDQCDMRKKSRFADGVCDEIVDVIVEEVVNRLDRIT